MITALILSAALAQCVAPTEALQSDVPRAVVIVDGQANVIDGAGNPSFVLLPKGLYLNDKGATKLNEKFQEMQIEKIEITTQNEALKAEVDRVVASEGGKVSLSTVLIVAGSVLAVGVGAGVGIGYAVIKK